MTALEVRNNHRRGLAMLAAGTTAALLVAACGSTNKTASSTNSSGSSSASSGSSSSGGGKAPSGSPVVFHAVLSETGAYSFLGSREAKALQGLAKAVNASGGIDGHPMQLDIKDNQSNPSTSVSIASQWISSGAQFLLNGSAVATNKAVDALATSNGPFIYDLSPGVHPKAGSMIFSAGQSTTADAEGYLTYLKSKGLTRIAIINSTDASGADGYVQFTHALSTGSLSGFQVLDHETFNPTAVSVTTQMAKIKATNPQAIIAWTTGTPLALVLRAMKSLNMDSIPTVTSDSNASYAELTKFANLVPQQLYFPTAALYLPPSDLSGPVATAVSNFDKAVTAEGGHGGDTWGLSYDPALLFIGALKHLGVNAKAPQILKYMQGLKNVPGIYGMYNTSYSDHRGVHVNNVYVSQWTGSTFKPVSGPGGAPPAPSSNG